MKKSRNDALLAVLVRESQLEADLAAKAAQARRQAKEMKLAAAALAEANERDRKEAWEEKLQQEAELLRSVCLVSMLLPAAEMIVSLLDICWICAQ